MKAYARVPYKLWKWLLGGQCFCAGIGQVDGATQMEVGIMQNT